MIARVSDAMPLAEGLEVEKTADLDVYKGQAKAREAPTLCLLALGAHPPLLRRSSRSWRLVATPRSG